MTSEVAYDRRFELLDLDSLCSNVSMASNCYRSQDVSSCFLLLPLLKPCQDGTLTSRASLGSKKGNSKMSIDPPYLWASHLSYGHGRLMIEPST